MRQQVPSRCTDQPKRPKLQEFARDSATALLIHKGKHRKEAKPEEEAMRSTLISQSRGYFWHSCTCWSWVRARAVETGVSFVLVKIDVIEAGPKWVITMMKLFWRENRSKQWPPKFLVCEMCREDAHERPNKIAMAIYIWLHWPNSVGSCCLSSIYNSEMIIRIRTILTIDRRLYENSSLIKYILIFF